MKLEPIAGTPRVLLLVRGDVRSRHHPEESVTYMAATGPTQQPFLGHWLLLTTSMFIANALLDTIQLVLARRCTI
jgi:hypothetical protein